MRFLWIIIILQLLLLGETTEEDSRHIVVVDMGSSGSRVFVFRFEDGGRVVGSKGLKVSPGMSTFVGGSTQAAAEYLQPLFHHASRIVPEQLHRTTPLFVKATGGMRLLPRAIQEDFYRRLFSNLTMPLRNGSGSSLPFHFPENHLGTIDGDDEAYFAALSVNYLTDQLDSKLQPREAAQGLALGALDLGGASTQIVFQPPPANSKRTPGLPVNPGGRENSESTTTATPTNPLSIQKGEEEEVGGNSPWARDHPLNVAGGTKSAIEQGAKDPAGPPEEKESKAPLLSDAAKKEEEASLGAESVFTKSFLSFGADQVRVRLWNRLLAKSTPVLDPLRSLALLPENHSSSPRSAPARGQAVVGVIQDHSSHTMALEVRSGSDDSTTVAASHTVGNPCGFRGHRVVWEGVVLVGTGDSAKCAEEVRKVLFDPAQCQNGGGGPNSAAAPATEAEAAAPPDHNGEDVPWKSPQSQPDASRSTLPTPVLLGGASTDLPPGSNGLGGSGGGAGENCPLAEFRDLPSVSGVEFVAMSVYFFALDCLRTVGGLLLAAPAAQAAQSHNSTSSHAAGAATRTTTTAGPPPSQSSSSSSSSGANSAEAHHAALASNWPNPTVGEVEAASARFCAAEWAVVSAPEVAGAHEWTWENQLPHRCFESVFIATLLGDGLGFDRSGRQVTYAVDLGGTEVEWTLGFALAAMAGA